MKATDTIDDLKESIAPKGYKIELRTPTRPGEYGIWLIEKAANGQWYDRESYPNKQELVARINAILGGRNVRRRGIWEYE